MNRVAVLLVWLLLPMTVSATETMRHDLVVTFDPATHRLDASDTVTLPHPWAHGKSLRFSLHAGLNPQVLNELATLQKMTPPSFGLYEDFIVTLPPGARDIKLRYAGEINHALSSDSAELAQGMRETSGIIAPEGVFLDGRSGWYPQFAEHTVSFSVEAHVPARWDVVSQGARTRHEVIGEERIVRWQETQPQDEIYVIAAEFTEYTQVSDATQAMVFLRNPDEALARTYLEATARYVAMYSQLLGPYPYAKFALVENFWESGFGMPSFTLLGSKVIRLPFIVNSSYPHEVLHNWWGNGVFVDYGRGNWSEGLTSYLADHLLQEQRGEGANYRRAALQKYTDFVSSARDFPLTEFRSRHSASTEAVGYGKTLMLFHMLRSELGDELFTKALREFYHRFAFKTADFDDVKQVFAETLQQNLDATFDPWVKRAGAPALRLRGVHGRPDGDAYLLKATLEQTQDGAPFPLQVPVAITLQGVEAAFQTRVALTGKLTELNLRLPARAVRFDVDPEFDVFRRLDRAEIPPALSQIYGADRVLILIPSKAPTELRSAYEQLAQAWRAAEPGKIEVKPDVAIKALPKDRAVWVFGWENTWRLRVAAALQNYAFKLDDGAAEVNSQRIERATQSIVVSARNTDNPTQSLAWLASDSVATLGALTRKLPHYARFSYLAFHNGDAANFLKGQWPVVSSPLSAAVRQDDGAAVPAMRSKLAVRVPLIAAPQ